MDDLATTDLKIEVKPDARKCPTCGDMHVFPLTARKVSPDDLLDALGYSPYGVSLGLYQKAKRDPGLTVMELLRRYGQSTFHIYRERSVDPEHIRSFLHGVIAGAHLMRGLLSSEAMELHQLIDDRSLEDAC
jgi:hypothetical protein